MHRRYLTVPLNEKGILEYNIGIEHSDNLYTSELPEKEFLALSVPLNQINEECSLLIDDYENEIIPSQYLIRCREIIGNMHSSFPVFTAALDLAINVNTMLALDL